VVVFALEHSAMLRTRSFGWRGCGIWRHQTSETVLARRRTDTVLRPREWRRSSTTPVRTLWSIVGSCGSCPASVDPAALHIGWCGGGAAAGAV